MPLDHHGLFSLYKLFWHEDVDFYLMIADLLV
jgi:hypothetical protein